MTVEPDEFALMTRWLIAANSFRGTIKEKTKKLKDEIDAFTH